MNYWYKDLHLRCFWEPWKRHYSLSLLRLYQITVILTICGYWLLQNLEKRKKSRKFNRLQTEVFFLLNISPLPPHPPSPIYRPIKFVLCPYICPGHFNKILRYFYVCTFTSNVAICSKPTWISWPITLTPDVAQYHLYNRTSLLTVFVAGPLREK